MSIVMSMSVCLCLCVREDISGTMRTRDLYQIFVHIAYGRGSVQYVRQSDEIPRGGGSFGVFLPIDNAL